MVEVSDDGQGDAGGEWNGSAVGSRRRAAKATTIVKRGAIEVLVVDDVRRKSDSVLYTVTAAARCGFHGRLGDLLSLGRTVALEGGGLVEGSWKCSVVDEGRAEQGAERKRMVCSKVEDSGSRVGQGLGWEGGNALEGRDGFVHDGLTIK